MRKLVRGVYYTGTITLFVLATLAGFSQTRAFKAWLLDRVVAAADESLNGRVEIGRIDGNLITGLKLQGVQVTERGVAVLKAERIEVTYDPIAIAIRRLAIRSIKVVRPEIFVYRSLDSTWNVSRLTRPNAPDSTPSPWTILVGQATLEDARIRLVDSLTLAHRLQTREIRPDSAVDYANLRLEGVQLSGGLEVAHRRLAIRLDDLSGTLQHPKIRIRKLAVQFLMTSDAISVDGLRMETDRSRLSGSASLGADLTELDRLAELEHSPTKIDLRAAPLNLRELRQFLYPSIEFLDREVTLIIAGRGTFGDLVLDRLSLQTPASFIQLRGTVTNLHRPSDLTLDVVGNESVVNSDDIRSLVPGLKIPDWSRFGNVRFFSSFKGEPARAFDAQVASSSERGSVEASATITLGSQLTYKGKARLTELDLGGLMGDGTELSRISGSVSIDGSDSDPRLIMGVVRADLDSSEITGLKFDRTVVVVNAAEGSYGVTVTSQAEWGGVHGSGRFTFGRAGGYSYGLKATINALNAEAILGHPAYASDINGELVAGGDLNEDGTRVDTLRFDLAPSSFGGRTVEPSVVKAKYQVLNGREQELVIDSDPLSVTVDGRFTPASLVTVIAHSGKAIGRYFATTFGGLDSLRAFSPRAPRAPRPLTHADDKDSVDLQVAMDVRDLGVVGQFARADLRGDAVGVLEVRGPTIDPAIQLDVLSRSMAYADSVVQIEARDVDGSFHSAGLVDTTLLSSFDIGSRISAGTVFVNGRRFDGAEAGVAFQGMAGTVEATGLMDSTLRFRTVGRSSFMNNLLELTLDTMSLNVHSYSLTAVEPAQIAVGRDGFLFRRVLLASEAQEFTASGYFSPAGVSDLTVGISNFLASDLRRILQRTAYEDFVRDVGGIVNGTLVFRGTLDHPFLRLDVGADGVRIRETVYGRLDVRMGYFEQFLDLYARLQSRVDDVRSRPDLLLTGRVPYSMTLKGKAPETPSEAAIDLEMVSQGLELRFLEPFMVDVTRAMRGTLTCDLRLKGTVAEPHYEGSASIRNGRFLFLPTRFEYLLDGDLVPEGDHIRLRDMVIRNTAEDFADGRMNATGTVTLQGIRLKGFDLGFAGQLQVMREDSSRLMSQKLYGDVTAETGPLGVRWQGDLDHSLLSGTVLVRNAEITLPPERESPRYSVRVIDVIRAEDPATARARFTLTPDTPVEDEPVVVAAAPKRSFVDRIDFNLVLETQGPTQVRFVFNRQTNDVLFADLRGRLGFQRSPGVTRLTGEVEVTNRSYYNFLKRFNATGKIFFTGDPLNPELDIVARYEGVHRVTESAAGSSLSDAGAAQQTKDENVAVVLYLKGPRSKLETRFDVEVEQTDGSWVGRKGDVEADAIAFIMSNQFRDELTEQQRSRFLGENLGYGLASGLVTGPLSETLRRTTKGNIQSLDVIYYGGSQFTSGTELRVTGQLDDAIIYRVGGRVDRLDKSNIVVEVPMSWVVNSPKLQNLILTLERRADGFSSLNDERRTSNSAKLLYRFTF